MPIVTTRPFPHVTQLLMDRPTSMNALDSELVANLRANIPPEDARVIVVGSTSPQCFSAGVDLRLAAHERAQVSRALYGLYRDMRSTDAIVIAAATGHAVGGGAQLMIAADIRMVASDVSIRFMGPGHGLAVGAWGLPGLVGRGRTMELLLSMRAVGAEEALSMGLVDSVVADPLQSALETARHIVGLSPEAVAAVKRIVALPSWDDALTAERDFNDRWDGTIPVRASDDG